MPDGEFLQRLHDALLSAYNQASFKRLLFEALGVRLEDIALGESLDEQIQQVIEWFEQQSRTEELVNAAIAGNKTNDLLLAFRNDYFRLNRPQRRRTKQPRQQSTQSDTGMDIETLEQLRRLTQRLEIIVEDSDIGLRAQIAAQNRRLSDIEYRLQRLTVALWIIAATTGGTLWFVIAWGR